VRGSEKKIIYVKDTGSKIFEEAYFVIRRGVDEGEGRPSENDMVREATRIVTQNSAAYPAARRRSRWRMKLLAFLAGAAAATSIFGGAWLLALL
jgi:hypothetical protein